MNETEKSALQKAREILENADEFEVWFDDVNLPAKRVKLRLGVKLGSESIIFPANRSARNFNKALQQKLVETFFSDVETGGDIKRCFIPHHVIKANSQNRIVEIVICFMCSLFLAETDGEEFSGSLPDKELSESKKIFDEIFEKHAADVR